MKKKKKGKVQPSVRDGDARAALWSADALRASAQWLFIRNITGRSFEEAHQVAAQNVGGMIAAATSLALALELYLKALCLLTHKPVLRDHNLWGQ